MAAASIAIDSVLPEEYALEDPRTVSTYVLRKNFVEILPTEQITYTPNTGQDSIKFTIASNNDFFICPESYLKFNFTNLTLPVTSSTLTNQPITPYDINQQLSSIGAHCLFRQMDVRAVASGTLLCQGLFYDHQSGIQQMYMPEDSAYAFISGQDRNVGLSVPPRNVGSWIPLNKTEGATGTADLTIVGRIQYVEFFNNGVQEGNAALVFGTEFASIGILNTGDVVSVTEATNGAVTGGSGILNKMRFGVVRGMIQSSRIINTAAVSDVTYINALANDRPTYLMRWLNGTPYGATAKMVDTGALKEIFVHRRGVHLPFGRRICDGYSHVVTMRINNSFFWYNWPLFLLKGGIEITLYLQQADISMMDLRDPATATTTLNYQIQYPRIVAKLSTPEPSVQRDLITKWNSEMGLVYYTPQIFSKRVTGQNGDGGVTLNLLYGKRSVRSIAFGIVPSNCQSQGSTITRTCDSYRCFIQSHVQYYQVQVASNMYPLRRMPVDAESVEPFVQSKLVGAYSLMDVDGTMNNIYERNWIRSPNEAFDNYYWVKTGGKSVSATEADVKGARLIEARDRVYCVDFSRSLGKMAILTGIDASMCSIDLILDRQSYNYNTIYGSTEVSNPFYSDIIIGNAGATVPNAYAGVFTDNPMYWSHIFADQFIRVSAQGIAVMN